MRNALSTEYSSISGDSQTFWLIFTEDDWSILLSISNVQKYQKGEVIIKQGTYNKRLYRIKLGEVRVQKSVTVCCLTSNSVKGPKGIPTTMTVGKMETGHMLGEMSILHLGVTRLDIMVINSVY